MATPRPVRSVSYPLGRVLVMAAAASLLLWFLPAGSGGVARADERPVRYVGDEITFTGMIFLAIRGGPLPTSAQATVTERPPDRVLFRGDVPLKRVDRTIVSAEVALTFTGVGPVGPHTIEMVLRLDDVDLSGDSVTIMMLERPPTSAVYEGRATLNGRPAPDGAAVVALVGGRPCSDPAAVRDGAYRVAVPPAAVRPGCGTAGATVSFTIDGRPATQTAGWSVGGTFAVDLSVDLPVPPPPPPSPFSQAVRRLEGDLALEAEVAQAAGVSLVRITSLRFAGEEAIVLSNLGGASQDLTGWSVVAPATGRSFFLPEGVTLAPGEQRSFAPPDPDLFADASGEVELWTEPPAILVDHVSYSADPNNQPLPPDLQGVPERASGAVTP